jgi:hypothetical protein
MIPKSGSTQGGKADAVFPDPPRRRTRPDKCQPLRLCNAKLDISVKVGLLQTPLVHEDLAPHSEQDMSEMRA